MLGTLASDSAGDMAREHLDSDEVATDGIEITASHTGAAHVIVDPDGENRIVSCPGANRAVDSDDISNWYERIASTDCLLLQNEIPVEPVGRLLADLDTEPNRLTGILDRPLWKASGRSSSIGPCGRRRAAPPRSAPVEGVGPLLSAPAVSYLTPKETEYEQLEVELDAFDGILVITRGHKAVRVHAVGGDQYHIAAPAVETNDSTGAGDVRNGFLGALLAAGRQPREAIELATTPISMATGVPGASRGIPTIGEVESFRDRA